MSGLKRAVIGLIGTAVVSVGKTVFFPNNFNTWIFTQIPFYISAAIFALTSVLAFRKIHPVIIICLSAVIGIVAGFAGLLN